MGETYITGDLHGKLLSEKSKLPALSKEDYIIVCGDFGFLLSDKKSKFEEENLDKLQNEVNGATICFIDGNHENFNRLESLKTEYKFENEVGKVRDGIYHLKRARPYVINGKSIFTFGGAISTDRMSRIPNQNWWYQEVPSKNDLILAENVITAKKFDYIITHTCPVSIREKIQSKKLFNLHCPTEIALESLKRNINNDFSVWYFGHFHADEIIQDKFRLLYRDIVKLGET